MKLYLVIVLLTIGLAAAGCSRVYGPREQVKTFADDKDALILSISKKVEADPTLAGVAEAQKLVDAKKDSLQSQRKAIDEAPAGMNTDWRSALAASQSSDRKMLDSISLQLSMACKESCSEVRDKFKQVEDSFNKATKLEGEI